MTIEDRGYSILLPEDQFWRESNLMKIPNTNLLEALGAMERMGGRLWRMPPYSANTWHKHIDSWEFYFVLEGRGRMRVGDDTIEVPRYGSVLVAPRILRQVFNDTEAEALWLIIASPQEGQAGRKPTREDFYPEDPQRLPEELAGHVWPPE